MTFRARFVSDDVIEVEETVFYWFGTSVYYWYHDMKNRLRSLHGNKGDAPVEPMTKDGYEWAVRHYLPLAEKSKVVS